MPATVIPFPSRTTARPAVAVWVRPVRPASVGVAVGVVSGQVATVPRLAPNAMPTEAAAIIRQALRARSGRAWSVTVKRGTSWGWIHVDVPPSRCTSTEATRAERVELARLLDIDSGEAFGGVSIPARWDWWAEYVARAQGVRPTVRGTIYWD